MPLKLRTVLGDYGISQADWGAAIKQHNGKPLSRSAATQILMWGLWPKLTSRDAIVTQTENYLLKLGVPVATVETVFDEEKDNLNRSSYQPKALNKKSARDSAKKPTSHSEELNLPENEMLSQEAKRHFSLFVDPFKDDVQSPDDVFLSTEQRYIREAMYQTAKHAGLMAVIGESGSGKTTLRRDMLDRIRRSGDPITVIQPRSIDKSRLTAGAICEAIIKDLDSSSKVPQSLEGKARKIEALLTQSGRAGMSHVLMIEEAHDLTVPVLKYLKRFWELEDGFKKLLGIVLIGQPELKGLLDLRRNWQAREFINRCEVAELQPLGKDLEAFLTLKFARINIPLSQVFETEGKDNVFDGIRERLTTGYPASMMYPLIVQNTVTKAMNLAAQIGQPLVSSEIIKEV